MVNEIKIFEQTRHITGGRTDTDLMILNTKVYPNPLDLDPTNSSKSTETEFLFEQRGSVASVMEHAQNSKTAVLNFADALTPGGLVLHGERTQEENICRCSNLYESLLQCEKEYYDVNRQSVQNTGTHLYTDTIIYSPKVAFFRDDVTYKILPNQYADVITCPAPAGSKWIPADALEEVLFRRIRGIIRVAIYNGVKTLILGAWGCGAFGQDPKMVASCFKNALIPYLYYNPYFDKVVFAIRPTFGEDNYIFDIFQKEFSNAGEQG